VSRRRKNKKDLPVFERVQIYDAGAEGKAIARVDNMVIFVPFGAPGDIVDIKVIGKRKSFYEGEIIGFHHYSDVRRSPKCEHFGLCGGCKWQHIEYGKQLYFKQKQVVDSFERIGKIKIPAFQSIIPSESEYFYRNKDHKLIHYL
jgi:23S rRNA (uracil1939-C5)-methyltransferase